jgi:hypothetical protein
VLGRQPRADLKERLSIPVGQLVEDRAARGIRQGLEDVTRRKNVMQAIACLSRSDHPVPGAGRLSRQARPTHLALVKDALNAFGAATTRSTGGQCMSPMSPTRKAPQLSLAWTLHKQPFIEPIRRSRKLERIQENLGATDIDLTEEGVRPHRNRTRHHPDPRQPHRRRHRQTKRLRLDRLTPPRQ